MPSRPSPAPRRCSPISRATPTGSPSRTGGSSPSTRPASPSATRTTAATAERQQVMTLGADEFIRRFLLHVLPRGLPPHPALRPARRRHPQGQHRPRPRTAGRGAHARNLPRRQRAARSAPALSLLRRAHAHHRDLRRWMQPRAPPPGCTRRDPARPDIPAPRSAIVAATVSTRAPCTRPRDRHQLAPLDGRPSSATCPEDRLLGATSGSLKPLHKSLPPGAQTLNPHSSSRGPRVRSSGTFVRLPGARNSSRFRNGGCARLKRRSGRPGLRG
jgi:hypothetical protein